MAAHLFTSREEVAQIERLSAVVIVTALALQCLSQLVWNGAMLLPLQTHMQTLGFWELYMVRAGGFLVAFMVPVAGSLAVRLAYLRRRGLGYPHFTWATLLSNALALLTVAAVAVAATGLLWMVAGVPAVSVIGLTGGVLVLGIAGLGAFHFAPRVAGHPLVRRWPWIAAFTAFEAPGRVLTWVSALALARHCCNFLTFGLLYQSLSPGPSALLTGGLVYALTSPIRMLHITPGNVGVNEWIVAIVGRALSYDLTTGLVVALVFRGLNLASQALGALAGGIWLALSGER
jgi:hypothetical protein